MKKVILTLIVGMISASSAFASVGTTQPPCKQGNKSDRFSLAKVARSKVTVAHSNQQGADSSKND